MRESHYMPMTYDDIENLVPGKVYQFVAILGGGDYPVGGLATLIYVSEDGIDLKMEFAPEGSTDAEWSLREITVPKNKMQWMRRLTTAPPVQR
jgi:hypothetical protein